MIGHQAGQQLLVRVDCFVLLLLLLHKSQQYSELLPMLQCMGQLFTGCCLHTTAYNTDTVLQGKAFGVTSAIYVSLPAQLTRHTQDSCLLSSRAPPSLLVCPPPPPLFMAD